MIFGDVFSRYHPFTLSEELFRKVQPVVEFVFAITEEAFFVHAIIYAKHVRVLSIGDVERILGHYSKRDDRTPDSGLEIATFVIQLLLMQYAMRTKCLHTIIPLGYL
ncbi:putative mediator of RNA polymerase II transcription subunit 13 [Forsythia ovata]|uniref:Mediator of RNA polymerase II transcription subunit 13 n=1 Tax=Forsythia ovata TaxID=205694 RepID=A0ABD1S3K2_9LAMI